MKLDRVIQLLKKNRTALDRLGVKTLAVFGSTVRDEATSSSDVDILWCRRNLRRKPFMSRNLRLYLEDINWVI